MNKKLFLEIIGLPLVAGVVFAVIMISIEGEKNK